MRTLLATALLTVAALHSISAQGWEPDRRWRHRDGLQVRIGRDYHLPADRVATSPIIVIGGSVTIDGRVEDDIVVVGGPVHIGPTAQVRSELVVIGADVQVADTAEVTGEIHDINVWWPDVRFAFRDWLWGIDRGWWAAFTLAGTVFRFTLIMLVSCLLALVAPRWIRRIEESASDAPLASGFVGLMVEMLFVPLVIVVVAALVLTVIGIPLLALVPFVLLAFILTWLAGFTAVAAVIGRRLRARVRLATEHSTAIDVAWGVMLLFLITFIGNLFAFASPIFWPITTALNIAGFVIEFLAWTIGLGAALMTPFQRRWPVTPPPVPSPASANA